MAFLITFILLLNIIKISIAQVNCTVNNGLCPQSCVNSNCVCASGYTQSTTCVFTPCVSNPNLCITITSVSAADSGLRRDITGDCSGAGQGVSTLGELFKGNVERNPIFRWNISPFLGRQISYATFSFNHMNSGAGVPTFFNALGSDTTVWGDADMKCWTSLTNIGGYPWGAKFAVFNASASGWYGWIPRTVEITGRVQSLLAANKGELQFVATSDINNNIYFAMKEQSGSLQPTLTISFYYPPVYNPLPGPIQLQSSFETPVTGWFYSSNVRIAAGSPFGGNGWLFSDANRRVETNTLISPWIPVPRSDIRLKFKHQIWGKSGYFGGVFEYRTTTNLVWADASSLLSTGGYTGTFLSGSPWGARSGFVGSSSSSNTYSFTLISRGSLAAFIGTSVQFRWVSRTDGPYNGGALGGWWIDDFSVSTPCGNGVVDTDEGETCEAGGIFCNTAICQCLNGFVASSPPSANCTCSPGWYGPTCTTSICGDGIRVGSEQCDTSIGCDNNCFCRLPLFVANATTGLCSRSPQTLVQRIDYTGAVVQFVFATNNVKNSDGIYIVAHGGGGGSTQGVSGGAGGVAFGWINAGGITRLQVLVGGAGTVTSGGPGVSFGGNGGTGVNGWNGAGGGGSTGIWFQELQTNAMIVAAGGGGAGAGWTNSKGGAGGGGGGPRGQDGFASVDPQPGGGGATQLTFGLGGCNSGAGSAVGSCGLNGGGPFGAGGDGAGGDESGGGGGGAGYFGGGGGKRDTAGGNGGAGGGGGGSSFINNITALISNGILKGANGGTVYSEASSLYGSPGNNGAVWIYYNPLVSTSSPLTTSPLTTNRLTTSPLTTSPLTTSPLTTSPLTTSPLTTNRLTTSPLTTSPLTTSPLTTSPLTTSPLTTSPLTTSPLTTSPITSGDITTQELTTSPLTTSPLTTSPLTTSPLTTSPLTSGDITTQELTTSPLTTSPLTTSPLTTSPLTTSPLTSGDITTQELTTQKLTTSPLTTSPLTTSPLTTSPLTSGDITTQELTTQELTTQELTTQELTTSELTTQEMTTQELTTQEMTTSEVTTGVNYPFVSIQVGITVALAFPPSTLDVQIFVADLATVLDIPIYSFVQIVVDFDLSTINETVVSFVIINTFKPDNTTVDPIAAADYLKSLANNQSRSLRSTKTLEGMRFISHDKEPTIQQEPKQDNSIIFAAIGAMTLLTGVLIVALVFKRRSETEINRV